MHVFRPADEVAALTGSFHARRGPDGRPLVPDELLARLKLVTTEEAWSVLRRHGYHFQFEGNWLNLHPERILVGRAVTARFIPHRPDLHEVVERQGQTAGRSGGHNSWVIDTLVPGDVLVVDLFGKVKDGTFAGDNLGTAIQARSGTGMIVDGGIRDLQRLSELPDFAVFVRGVDPSAIANVTLVDVNGPVRIGQATVLPGDLVLGTPTGVIFIPPALGAEVAAHAENTRLRDEFGQLRLGAGVYSPGEIDVPVWAERIEADFKAWRARRSPGAS